MCVKFFNLHIYFILLNNNQKIMIIKNIFKQKKLNFC